MRDLHNNLAIAQNIKPQAIATSGNVSGATVDLAGFDAAELVASVGTAGVTLCATIRFDVFLEGAPDNGTGAPGSWTAITDADDVIGAMADIATGKVVAIDSAAKDDQAYKIGVVNAATGSRRFVRLRIAAVGTHGTGTPFDAISILGCPANAPVA
jgi:hypothetical protein